MTPKDRTQVIDEVNRMLREADMSDRYTADDEGVLMVTYRAPEGWCRVLRTYGRMLAVFQHAEDGRDYRLAGLCGVPGDPLNDEALVVFDHRPRGERLSESAVARIMEGNLCRRFVGSGWKESMAVAMFRQVTRWTPPRIPPHGMGR